MVDTIITSLADSVISSGSISEAHILLGLFIITIITLRKSKVKTENQSESYGDIISKIDCIQQKIDDLDLKVTLNSDDLSQIRTDLNEIKMNLSELNSKIQP